MVNAKTYSQKPSEITHKWILIDASSAPLGRVATVIAKYLIGKYKPTYTPHMDAGDYVVVINAEKLIVTGAKETDKKYYHHSGYPGGLRATSWQTLLDNDPETLVYDAVKGMVPKNRLGRAQMGKLYVYAGAEHPHAAQMPTKYDTSAIRRG